MSRLLITILEEHASIRRLIGDVEKSLLDISNALAGEVKDKREMLEKAAQIGILIVKLTSMLKEHEELEESTIYRELEEKSYKEVLKTLRSQHINILRLEEEAYNIVRKYRLGKFKLEELVEGLKSKLDIIAKVITQHLRLEEEVIREAYKL